MKAYFLSLALLACEPQTRPFIEVPVPTYPIDLASALPTPCQNNGGSRTTPETGSWLVDACRAHCLPPEQVFAICTSKFGRIFSTRAGLQTPAAYGASWEIKTLGCPDYPWRVWQLTVFNMLSVGNWSAPSIQSDCSAEAKTQTGLLPFDRVYYTASEVPVSTVL